ncbi:MAG: hypothetical protein ACL93V_05505 [Candidatus Electrothrix sp. YB6]
MLLPREKPFLTGLNSYYLDLEKFIQHLQGEIGSGCLYCKSADQELLVYFDEYDVIRGVVQDTSEHARVSPDLDRVMESLRRKNFLVTIYYLDPDSIFFWGQMPAFKRAKGLLSSDNISLPDLIFRLSEKEFSGFIEIDMEGREDCAVLFFHRGQRRGGSYYWGTGGLSASDTDYNILLGMLQQHTGHYKLAYFTSDPLSVAAEYEDELQEPETGEQEEKTAEEEKAQSPDQAALAVINALNEFTKIFIRVAGTKIKTDPIVDLKLKFVDFVSIYPQLDPYQHLCAIDTDGTVTLTGDIPAKEAAEGIVDCAWMVIEENRLRKKFRAALQGMAEMASGDLLRTEGIDFIR